MRPFFVCDKHPIPLRFLTQQTYESHMKQAHREQFFETLQTEMDIWALKRKDEDPYDDYYNRKS
jgi:hypothetical protein